MAVISLSKILALLLQRNNSANHSKMLWERPHSTIGAVTLSPTSSTEEYRLLDSIKDYDNFIILFEDDNLKTQFAMRCANDEKVIHTSVMNVSNSSAIQLKCRVITFNSEADTITFSQCYSKKTSNTSSVSNTNSYCTPIKILGIKNKGAKIWH